MILDEMELEQYKKHPRVLEIRFILLFNIIEKELGYQQTMKFYQAICSAFNCNMTLINSLINKRFEIQRNSKKKWRFWRQEVIFSSYLYGESIYKVARDYFNIKPETIYTQKEFYDIERFLTNEWLDNFDDQVTLCGEYSYRNELIRFMEVIDNMNLILKKWSGE